MTMRLIETHSRIAIIMLALSHSTLFAQDIDLPSTILSGNVGLFEIENISGKTTWKQIAGKGQNRYESVSTIGINNIRVDPGHQIAFSHVADIISPFPLKLVPALPSSSALSGKTMERLLLLLGTPVYKEENFFQWGFISFSNSESAKILIICATTDSKDRVDTIWTAEAKLGSGDKGDDEKGK